MIPQSKHFRPSVRTLGELRMPEVIIAHERKECGGKVHEWHC
jgi:hypothetical protein